MEHKKFEELTRQAVNLENNFKRAACVTDRRAKMWEQFDKQYNLIKSGSSTIRLNVGGVKFTTNKETLCAIENSYFTKLLSKEDTTQEVFIDRPGKHFNKILSYLRTKKLPNLLDSLENEKAEVLEEATFYEVNIIAKFSLMN